MSRPETTEDLEFNLFYQAIQVKRVSERERNSKAWTSPIVPAPLPPLPQTRFLQQYEHAQQNCWLVCIPRATSLTGCSLTRSFVGKSISQDHQLQTTTSAFDQ